MKIPNYDSISESDSDYKRLLPYMPSCTFRMLMCGASGCGKTKGAFVWEYSGIRMYSGIYSGYSAQNGIQLFRNENSSQTNAYLHYSNYSYSGLIPNERALILLCICSIIFSIMIRFTCFPKISNNQSTENY